MPDLPVAISIARVMNRPPTRIHTSGLLHLVGLCARRSQTVGAQVLADIGRIRGIKIAVPVEMKSVISRDVLPDGQCLFVSTYRGPVCEMCAGE